MNFLVNRLGVLKNVFLCFSIHAQNYFSFFQLARLKRSYEKLMKKQLKGTRQSSKSQEEDQSEIKILTKKLEVGGKIVLVRIYKFK